MKLHYFSEGKGRLNFGDDLNPWLWDKLLPGFFDDDQDSIFVGIGTLLNEGIPSAKQTIVFGSGFGYGKQVPKIDETWKIYCLRGPLTAEALGVSKKLAITDSAMLLGGLEYDRKPGGYSYMPHALSSREGGRAIQSVCNDVGVNYIDAGEPTEEIIRKILNSEVLLTEAMHGAIAAESFGVPWIPIVSREFILPFKWYDWCKSLNLEYKPERLLPIWDKADGDSYLKSIKLKAKKLAVKHQLKKIVNTCKPISASKGLREKKISELYDSLQKFKVDFKIPAEN